MAIANTIEKLKLELAQIAWVVKDIEATKQFFSATLGISFPTTSITKLADFKSTYYGEPTAGESLVSQAYNGHTFIELIQPLSGPSVFNDYIEKNPNGGVQHVAYRLPIAGLEAVIQQFADQGYPVVSRFDTFIADIVFLDTTTELGVMTEIMGITDEGWQIIEKMK